MLTHYSSRRPFFTRIAADPQYGLTTWKQYQYNIKTVKRSYRNAQQSKNATTENEHQKLTKVQEAHQEYIDLAASFLNKVSQTIGYLRQNKSLSVINILKTVTIDEYINRGKRQIDQIRRRVLCGEVIPNKEKVFSLFEPHTEWVCKRKLGVSVELGVRVCVVEGQLPPALAGGLNTRLQSGFNAKAFNAPIY